MFQTKKKSQKIIYFKWQRNSYPCVINLQSVNLVIVQNLIRLQKPPGCMPELLDLHLEDLQARERQGAQKIDFFRAITAIFSNTVCNK